VNRRCFLAFPFLRLVARADASGEVWALLARMAGALSADNPDGFLEPVDPAMPGYEQLATFVKGVVQQAEVRSVIDKVVDEGDNRARTIQLNWLLQMKQRGAGDRTENREQLVTCKLAKQGQQWRVVSLAPIDFFKPPVFA
jgi:hypothetical protein